MSKLVSLVFTVASITLSVANTARAQEPNQGNPTILTELQNLQASLDALASQLAAIGTPPTVISTGLAVRPAGATAACHVQNVGVSSPVTVTTQLWTRQGGLQVHDPDRELGPRQGFIVPNTGGTDGTGAFWCRFVTVSGSSADIRGNLVIVDPMTQVELSTREAR